MSKEEISNIANEAVKIYQDYNCTILEAVARAGEVIVNETNARV